MAGEVTSEQARVVFVPCLLQVPNLGQAEIQELSPGLRQHDVPGLEISMNYSVPMGLIECLGYFDRITECRLERQRPFVQPTG